MTSTLKKQRAKDKWLQDQRDFALTFTEPGEEKRVKVTVKVGESFKAMICFRPRAVDEMLVLWLQEVVEMTSREQKELMKDPTRGVECPKCGDHFTTRLVSFMPATGSKATDRTTLYPKVSCKVVSIHKGTVIPCLSYPLCVADGLEAREWSSSFPHYISSSSPTKKDGRITCVSSSLFYRLYHQ